MLQFSSLTDTASTPTFPPTMVPREPWNVKLDDIATKLATSGWSDDAVKRGIEEYRRFLALKLLHPEIALVPNKALDEVWHQHILDTRAYMRDCDRLFGHYMHHNPNFGVGGEAEQKALSTAFADTVALYERYFGTYPLDWLSASRCQDHDCHVPSSCACRSPGACK